jgi:hypothetical protein
MNTAIVFLTKEVQVETKAFAKKLSQHFDVFIFDDTNIEDKGIGVLSKRDGNVETIKVSDNYCKDEGYYGTNIVGQTHIAKEVLAIDKFLFEFCEHRYEYKHVWVFEDDVFIPSVETIINLNKKYRKYDLVTPNNFEKNDKILDWHWKHVFDKTEPPYFYSMVCGMKVSRKMLNQIRAYVKANKRLFYLEVMFNTLANHAKLKVRDAFELKSVCWIGHWAADEFMLLPNNVFHPLKNLNEYEIYRKEIEVLKKSNYIPTNRLPHFIKNLMP